MTTEDLRCIPVLDHGFVRLVDWMGDDSAIVQAARVSYGDGTKKISDDRALIRYLMRHNHSSPIEMCEFKFGLKMPIFVARQLIRHRTANVNEISARYSVITDEFYMPDLDQIKPQSRDNKQGRAGEIDAKSQKGVQWLLDTAYQHAYAAYRVLLGEREDAESHYDPFASDEPLLTEQFPGIARELARSVLPVATYTEMFWKIDLSNLFKFLKLRQDAHAQYEIRVLADAIFTLIQPLVPLACEAFIDYQQKAVLVSRMEVDLLRDLLRPQLCDQLLEDHGDHSGVASAYGMTKRELTEFMLKFSPAVED